MPHSRTPRALALSALVLLAAASSLTAAKPQWKVATPAVPKPTFLILGTFHFEGSTADLMSNQFPDVLSEKRQAQIEQVVDAIARFKPTKIAVEAPLGSTKTQERYASYLKGESTLTADETDQIAFRLARKLGHSRIYPVDHKLDLDFDKTMAAIQKTGRQDLLDGAMKLGKGQIDTTQHLIDTSTVGAALRQLNSPKVLDWGLEGYLLLAQVRDRDATPGAELLADWSRRNLLIFNNLTSLIESPQERVLLLIGAGHATLLRQYIAGSPNLRLEEAVSYLP
jgi:hypothetical protein